MSTTKKSKAGLLDRQDFERAEQMAERADFDLKLSELSPVKTF